MRITIFFIIFIAILALTYVAIVRLHKTKTSQDLESDLRRNGIIIQGMLERYYLHNNRHGYPDDLTQLFDNQYVMGGDRIQNPYTHSYIHVSEHGETGHSPGYFLYVPTDIQDGKPRGYRIYIPGYKTDRFYDPAKASEWKSEYELLTGRKDGPDNIVMCFQQTYGELPARE
jgi:hypothetical protein